MNKELYHGTTFRRVPDFFDGNDDLFGVRYLKDPSMSASLTDNKNYACLCAVGASIADFAGHPALVVLSIPEEELVCEGVIAGNKTIMGYSTTHRVEDLHQLPERFLEHLGITVDQAIRDYAKHKVEFYRVPHKYISTVDVVD